MTHHKGILAICGDICFPWESYKGLVNGFSFLQGQPGWEGMGFNYITFKITTACLALQCPFPQAAPIEEVPGHQLSTVVLTNALYYNKPKVLSFPLKISFIAIVRVKNNDKKRRKHWTCPSLDFTIPCEKESYRLHKREKVEVAG